MEPNYSAPAILPSAVAFVFYFVNGFLLLFQNLLPTDFLATLKGSPSIQFLTSVDPDHGFTPINTTTNAWSYPASLFSVTFSFAYSLISWIIFHLGLKTIFCCFLVYFICRLTTKQSSRSSSSAAATAAGAATTHLFYNDKLTTVYVLNYVDNFSKTDATKSQPTPVPQLKLGRLQRCFNNIHTIYYSFFAAFTPSNSHYQFPAVEMGQHPAKILNSIATPLHNAKFNSQLLQHSLFNAATVKIDERLLLLLRNSIHFKSLSEFKVWLLRLAKISSTSTPSTLDQDLYFNKQVQKALSTVFSTPIALNLLDLQSHLFKWAQLHYLLGIKASYLFPLLEHSVWSSHPWLCSAIHKILKRHPDIDFQDLLFKLANTHLFVPQTFPCNPDPPQLPPKKALPAPSNSSLLSNTTSSPSDTLKFIRDMHSTSILSTSKSE